MPLEFIKPFEICSIRPPTENYSLTFRLTRNCYWNKCAFCPVYKLGAKFSKRGLEEVLADIGTAKRLDDLLRANALDRMPPSADTRKIISRIVQEHGLVETESDTAESARPAEIGDNLDPRLAWFLQWFSERPTLADNFSRLQVWRYFGGTTCFLGDGDNLVVPPELLGRVIQTLRSTFPSLQRFTIYGRTKSAARLRTVAELQEYRRAGLQRVHYGLESGSDKVLKAMEKGVTAEEHVEGGCKTREAGLSCSVYVMPGLGGQAFSEDHARETADVLNRIQPDFIRLRSLEIFPQTPLEEAYNRGDFIPASESEVVEEIRHWVQTIQGPTELLSDSASNLLSINGRLPEDRDRMLAEIDAYLGLSEREKLVFSAQARLQSFAGQYGGLTEDIYRAVAPYLSNHSLDFTGASDADLAAIIVLVRAKLMP